MPRRKERRIYTCIAEEHISKGESTCKREREREKSETNHSFGVSSQEIGGGKVKVQQNVRGRLLLASIQARKKSVKQQTIISSRCKTFYTS